MIAAIKSEECRWLRVLIATGSQNTRTIVAGILPQPVATAIETVIIKQHITPVAKCISFFP